MRTTLLLTALATYLLTPSAEGSLVEENFDSYLDSAGFMDVEAGDNFFYVTEDNTSGGNRVAQISEQLGTTGSINIYTKSGSDRALRVTSGTGATGTFNGLDGHVMAVDLPGSSAPKGGPLATPHNVVNHTFSVSMRQTSGPAARFSWLAVDVFDNEVFGTVQFNLSSTFQTYVVTADQFAGTGIFDPTQVANFGFDFFLQSGSNASVSTPIVLEIDNISAIPYSADFDQDSDIDGADFLTWQRNFGTGTTFGQGDANSNGSIDGEDLLVWQQQFGTSPIPGAVAVPEPSTVALLVFAFVAICGIGRSRV